MEGEEGDEEDEEAAGEEKKLPQAFLVVGAP